MPDLKNEISVLFEGMEVTDEQKEKFQTNLEAVVASKVAALKEEIEAENEKTVSDRVDEQVEELTAKIDDYLTYVVEQWEEENRLAIETGVKVEVMESFIDGMKVLFAEHYVDIPEGKDDLVTVAEGKVEELTGKLNSSISENIRLKKELSEIKVDGILDKISEGLTETQKEKFESLVEDIDSSDLEKFERKAKTIRESFFKEDAKQHEDDKKSINENVDRMSLYAKAL